MNLNVSIEDQIQEIYHYITSQVLLRPKVAIILGSGLGEIANDATDKIVIKYKDIPYLSHATAPGHSGNLVFCKIFGKDSVIMQGRLHLYEGHSAIRATLLIRVLKLIGVETLIITCAAGGLNMNFTANKIMVINDHINFTGTNPLIGPNLKNFGVRFPNMFDIYTPKFQQLVKNIANQNQIELYTGVYAAILGPMYATRAELKFYIQNNCDAIGMSVVHEAIIAAHSGMQILGLAAITDMALPDNLVHATEEEVLEAGLKLKQQFTILINHFLQQIN